METAIIVVWIVTLIVALVLTVWILKLVEIIVRTEQDILSLARTTLAAAKGIQNNTSLILGLGTTKEVAGNILGVALAIESVSASIKKKLSSVGGSLAARSL
ncbi:MAG: hypothetical protein ACR2M8_03225 [Pyrinomonadaceae bacterium]